jgi:hypothetical protein
MNRHNTFYNILTKRKNDPTREFILDMEYLYKQRIIEKKRYIREELRKLGIQNGNLQSIERIREEKERRLNRLKNQIQRVKKTSGRIENENRNENKRERLLNEENEVSNEIAKITEALQIAPELKNPFLFEGYGLTLDQYRRINIIKGIYKYRNLLNQLIDFYPSSGNTERKRQIREAFKGRVEERRGKPLPTREETKMNVEKMNELRREFLNPLRDEEYASFLDLKKAHLKYNEKQYTTIELFSTTTNKNTTLRRLQENIQQIHDEEELITRLGINKIQWSERAILEDGIDKELIKRYFIYWIKELLLPIQIPLNYQEATDLYLTYNDYILLNLQFYLLYILNETHTKNATSEEYKRGMWGAPFRINDHVFKHEHLRHRELEEFSKRKLYPYYNYQMTIYFIGYMIQHYCYSYFPRYLPKANKITFDLERDLSETNMNVASKYNNNNGTIYTHSCNLGDFFKKPCIFKRRDFTSLFFQILKEISKMLMEMQEKIGFVHYDFHTGNIIINYKYSNELINENNSPKNDITIKFELKMIDFTFSSILLQNESHKIQMLKYTNMQIYRNPNILNPLYHDFNKVYDLLYYLFSILFHAFLIKKKENTSNNLRRYEPIFQKIKEIYNFKEDYIILYKSKFEKISVKTAFIMLSDVNIFREILGTNVNLQNFIPSELYQYLESNPI